MYKTTSDNAQKRRDAGRRAFAGPDAKTRKQWVKAREDAAKETTRAAAAAKGYASHLRAQIETAPPRWLNDLAGKVSLAHRAGELTDAQARGLVELINSRQGAERE